MESVETREDMIQARAALLKAAEGLKDISNAFRALASIQTRSGRAL